MQNEKKNFEKMKSEHIKLHADLNILKEDVKEILNNYSNLVKRVMYLEDENKNLRQHNKNLVRYISQSGGVPENIAKFNSSNYLNNNFGNKAY